MVIVKESDAVEVTVRLDLLEETKSVLGEMKVSVCEVPEVEPTCG